MGCCFSCKRLMSFSSSSSSSSSAAKSKVIRIIHLNGYIQEIGYPVTVAEVTGKPASHFVFTQPQLLAPAPAPLKMDTPLEPSRAYFLLPFSLFDANVSPVDLAPIARKLALMAQLSNNKDDAAAEVGNGKSSKTNKTWKPILSTIRERSFNRRESDVHDKYAA